MDWYNHITHEVVRIFPIFVPAVASQIMTWVTVQEMESEELLCNICTLNIFKVHQEEVQPTGPGFNNTVGLKQLIDEACMFFSEAVAQGATIPTLIMLQGGSSGQPRLYMWAMVTELIKDTDKKIHEQSALLYQYSNQLNTLEALTGSEFELMQQWVDMVKGRDDKLDNEQGRLQSR
ncbi:hypothetical protein V8B97DRAFT_1918400 [Scleroderma yunnanense]